MNRDENAGTFLSGGFVPSEPIVDLPDPNEFIRGTLYRDENSQIWRLDIRPGADGKRSAGWTRVTAVSAEQQKRDRTLSLVLALAAAGGTLGMIHLVNNALDIPFLLALPFVFGVSFGFGWPSWRIGNRANHQVVLPAEATVHGSPEKLSSPELHPGDEER